MEWVNFYEEFANALLGYRSTRTALLDIVRAVHEELHLKYPLVDTGGVEHTDTCPFTVFGCFNKGISNDNRIAIMRAFKKHMGIEAEAPTSFNGVPVLNNMKSFFFAWTSPTVHDDIESNWAMFDTALQHADHPDADTRAAFIRQYNRVIAQPCIKWNMSMALYWIRPQSYVNLDSTNRALMKSDDEFHDVLRSSALPDGEEYLRIVDTCKQQFAVPGARYTSFPQMSATAWEAMHAANWVFQINPNAYRGLDAIRDLDVLVMSVNQYKKQIKKNHRAYIWLAGTEGGLVARGTITSDPAERMRDPDDPYYIDATKNTGKHLSVEIRLDDKLLDLSINRDVLLNDERLRTIQFLKFANATNFALTDEQARTLDDLIDGDYQQIPVVHEEPSEEKKPTRRIWIFAPGEGARLWGECVEKGIMSLGWDGLGDLQDYDSKSSILQKLEALHDGGSHVAYACWQFAHDVQPGDIVYAKKGLTQLVGRGIVRGDYCFDDSRPEHKSIRDVDWTHDKTVSLSDCQLPGKTLTDITTRLDYQRIFGELYEVEQEAEEVVDKQPQALEPYGADEFLSQVFMAEERFDRLSSLLRRSKNLIIQGAPGVGKTYAAKRLAFAIMGVKDDKRVHMVQFHQSYSYEDFIMGYRPTASGFELREGPFYRFCERAREDGREHFFIIDEINRGNLSKIFGELMMLIEKDKRGVPLQLLYREETFSVPENLYIIGLMNTADRSLAIIDYALRRRFAFFDFEPAYDTEGFKELIGRSRTMKFEKLISVIKQMNGEIAEDAALGKGYRIGHGYFGDKPELIDDHFLEDVVLYELIPLIAEYWYDREEIAKQWADRLRGALHD